MTLVRNFVEHHPAHSTTLFISGRANYFGTPDELAQALGFWSRKVTTFTLNEFSLEQIQTYLRLLGLDEESVPDWLPSRPLLVGYLAVKGVLHDSLNRLSEMSRAEGWDYLLEQICEREGKQIADLGGQPERVRQFVERLATRARATTSGRGPISVREMTDLFKQVFPASPDEAAQQLLLRIAGMTVSKSAVTPVVATATDQEDAREFLDEDIADAARAGDVVRFIKYSYDDDLNRLFEDPGCTVCMRDLGLELTSFKLQGTSAGHASAALKVAAENLNAAALGVDIICIMQRLGISAVDPDKHQKPIVIRDGYFSELEFVPNVDLSMVVLKDCVIDNIYVDRRIGQITGPRLMSCLVEQAFGAVSRADLPAGIVDGETQIENFKADVDTANDIRRQPLPESVRVLLVTLRKLFVQPGRGRKESAFPRGLDEVERPYVEDILSLVARYDFAHPQRLGGPAVWIPNRAKLREAYEILRAPQESKHPLIVDAREL